MNQTTAIDLARGLAAMCVAGAHLRNHMLPDYKSVAAPHAWFKLVAFLSGFASQAVIVFFVLSGWLVGGALLSRLGQSGVVKHYAIDRVSRLWTVLIPVFLLSWVLADTSPGEGMKAYVGAALFAQNLLGLQTIVADCYAGNYPLWSLANETAYYALFPACLIAFTPSYAAAQRLLAGFLATAGLLALIALKASIVLYFTIWLMGAAASRFHVHVRDRGFESRACRVALGLAFALVCIAARVLRLDSVFVSDAIIAAVFAALLCTLPDAARGGGSRIAGPAAVASSFSFTLYVIHVPLIYAFESHLAGFRGLSDPAAVAGLLAYAALLAVILIVAFTVSRVTEMKTPHLRKLMKRLMLRSPAGPPAARQGMERS